MFQLVWIHKNIWYMTLGLVVYHDILNSNSLSYNYMTWAAYVAGEQEGLIPEKSILMGETLKVGTHLDIESELNLIKETLQELKDNCSTELAGRKTMKEIGLKRSDRNINIYYVYSFQPLGGTANLVLF